VKILREEEKREKEEDVAQLEETVITLRQQNEKERLALLEFEDVLRKHKQRVEKQRRWAETQSSYRLCLERMIRDTMHQYALSLPHQYCFEKMEFCSQFNFLELLCTLLSTVAIMSIMLITFIVSSSVWKLMVALSFGHA
jgi:hypothetical protein